MRIAVLGSAGFIAGYVIEELHKQGHSVLGLQRHYANKDDIFDSQAPDELYIGDITNPEIVSRVVSTSEGVLNLAGRLGTSEEVNNPYPAVHVNILGTLNTLEACRTWKRPFVQIAVGNHWMNNTYSITRTTAERFTKMYVKEHGLKANVVRALNAYGPRQSFFSYRKIIPSFVLSALTNKPLMIYGDGEQRMDMIHVKDLASFLVSTLLDPGTTHKQVRSKIYDAKGNLLAGIPDNVKGEVGEDIYGNSYQCGEGEAETVNQIAKRIIDISCSTSEIEYLPMRAGEPVGATIMADYQSPAYNLKIEEGLRDAIKYYKKNLSRYII